MMGLGEKIMGTVALNDNSEYGYEVAKTMPEAVQDGLREVGRSIRIAGLYIGLGISTLGVFVAFGMIMDALIDDDRWEDEDDDDE
eukprot:m.77282 g.77282  ORF g.77282 m.77282 type:complete len:85 (+) comp12613_c0_seq5:442-696(+)